jgi:DNA-binding MarR family transcriptional regulator
MSSGTDATFLPSGISAQCVEGILSSRRKREQIFGNQLFADPAWDILLVLYAFHLGGRCATTMDICKRTAAPQTTSLRWICRLEREGLVVRTTDEEDRRRTFVRLSDGALKKSKQLFTELEDEAFPI